MVINPLDQTILALVIAIGRILILARLSFPKAECRAQRQALFVRGVAR